jgi:GDPmannose 4,6-dehydratase
VREFVEQAFHSAGIGIAWQGKGVREIGVDKADGRVLVRVNPKFFRPTEVSILQADYSKAARQLGWNPDVTFTELVGLMVKEDLRQAGAQKLCADGPADKA